MEQNKKGGKREGAGRKPSGIEKKTISLYVEKGKIYKFGSEEKMKQHLYNSIDSFGLQDLNKPTNEIRPHEQPKTNYFVDTTPKPTQPLLSQEGVYIQELKDAKIISEIQEIIKAAKADMTLAFAAKMRIEKFGQELSKNMYND